MEQSTWSEALPLDDALARAQARDELVSRARRGDHEAYASLVTAHFEASLRMARAITGNEADARDATQDAFLAVWRGLPGLRDATRFEPWLHQVLRNRCRDLLRRRGRVREIAIGDHDVAMPDPGDARVEQAALLAAFDRLSIDERRIVVLHHLEGHPLADIARELGIPVGTLKSRLFTARRTLQRHLEGQR